MLTIWAGVNGMLAAAAYCTHASMHLYSISIGRLTSYGAAIDSLLSSRSPSVILAYVSYRCVSNCRVVTFVYPTCYSDNVLMNISSTAPRSCCLSARSVVSYCFNRRMLGLCAALADWIWNWVDESG